MHSFIWLFITAFKTGKITFDARQVLSCVNFPRILPKLFFIILHQTIFSKIKIEATKAIIPFFQSRLLICNEFHPGLSMIIHATADYNRSKHNGGKCRQKCFKRILLFFFFLSAMKIKGKIRRELIENLVNLIRAYFLNEFIESCFQERHSK